MSDQEIEGSKTLEMLRRLDQRIRRVEAHLGLSPAGPSESTDGSATTSSHLYQASEYEVSPGLESRLGELGMSYAGGAILLLGITFLMAHTRGLGHPAIAAALGYLAAGFFYLIARVTRERAAVLSGTMIGASLILLYYSTLRLHYFVPEPLVVNAAVVLVALALVVSLNYCVAWRRNSESIALLATLMALALGLFVNTPRLGLPIFVIVAAIVVQLALRREWWMLLGLAIVATYAGHLLWLMNNPVMGRPLGAIARDEYSLALLLLCAAVFCRPPLARDPSAEPLSIVVILLNSFGLSVIASLAVYAIYQSAFAGVCLACAAFFLAVSALQWLKTRQQLAAAIYACFGYIALSAAFYGYAGIPAVFLWLCLQSLLVVCMALWFRSRFLVVANSVVFLAILGIYVTSYPPSDWVNFSFALVGHASARIINWQKERLTLRTEMLRNVYLGIGFVFVLYGLYHAVPSQYVTMSWAGAAVVYFLISVALRNIKYRWLAINSMVVTITYLFMRDLTRLESKYLVPAFLSVGIAALAISLYYARTRRPPGRDEDKPAGQSGTPTAPD